MTCEHDVIMLTIMNSTGMPKDSDHPERVKETDAASRDNHLGTDILLSPIVTRYDSTCGTGGNKLPTSTE